MAFLPQFEYELFLSYGRAGNEDPSTGDRKWVYEFTQLLERNLSDSLTAPARVFLDIRHAGSGEVDAAVEKALRSSALFLAVLTPYSCRQDSWMRREYGQFIDQSLDPVSQEVRAQRSQVFGIRIRDVDHSQWPANFKQIDFVRPGLGGGLDQVDISELSALGTPRDYFNLLVWQIKKELERIEVQIKKTVFFSETSQSLSAKRSARMVETRFKDQLTLEAGAHTEESAIEHLLRWSGSSFHIIDGELVSNATGATSRQERHLRLALQRFSATPRSVTVWTAPKSGIKASDYAPSATLIEDTPIQETEITDPGAKTEPLKLPFGHPYVYIDCVSEDAANIKSLKDCFQKKGVGLRLPVSDPSESRREKYNRRFIQGCYGGAVLWGNRPEGDALDACENLQKEKGDNLPIIILMNPDDDQRRNFFHPQFGYHLWDPSAPCLTVIEAFLDQVLQVGK